MLKTQTLQINKMHINLWMIKRIHYFAIVSHNPSLLHNMKFKTLVELPLLGFNLTN